MARPLKGKTPMVKVSLMVEADMLARINALIAQMQRRMPLGTLEWSQVARELLARGLEAVEAEQATQTPARRTRKAG